MAAKDLLDSDNAKNGKPASTMQKPNSANNADQKKHMPCKNSLPT
ncbi:MAG: hypothetical protein H6Q72_859 [Firmicutes bacterium]|nr:hypothetical protein [Bacillota bacterium]